MQVHELLSHLWVRLGAAAEDLIDYAPAHRAEQGPAKGPWLDERAHH